MTTSGWLAHHFYYHADQDVLLKEFVRPALADLLSRELIDRFFFIRYTVGGRHLRLRYRLRNHDPLSAAEVDRILQRRASRFLTRWPSTASIPTELIRRESAAILEQVPEESELAYPDNTLLPFPFEPEVERYGGEELVLHSLDFFVVSSAQVLDGLATVDASGKRGALALRLLLRQAWGYAETTEELVSHLGYSLPVGQAIGEAIWQSADADFGRSAPRYRALLMREILPFVGAVEAPVTSAAALLVEAASRLSATVGAVDPSTRWQIGHSNLHMTANRVGFFPRQEMYLQRILWRTAQEIAESDPALWTAMAKALARRSDDREPAPLRDLLPPLLRQLAAESTQAGSESPSGRGGKLVGRTRRLHERATSELA